MGSPMTSRQMTMEETELDDVLEALLDSDAIDGAAELEIDPIQMPVALSSITYTIAVHC